MAGYAVLSPTAVAGPPGWIFIAVGGTILTVGTIILGKEIWDYESANSSNTDAKPIAKPIAIPVATTAIKECDRKPRRYGARVHAQGTDCGGTSSSTIGVPGISRFSIPITVLEGIGLSTGTWNLLGRRQQNVREEAKLKVDAYILGGPGAGGRPVRPKSYAAKDKRGGKRYDVDVEGDGPSFIN